MLYTGRYLIITGVVRTERIPITGKSSKMADEDDVLLQQLTKEEVEELSELIDPDVRNECVCLRIATSRVYIHSNIASNAFTCS